jgi:hypothetical protein
MSSYPHRSTQSQTRSRSARRENALLFSGVVHNPIVNISIAVQNIIKQGKKSVIGHIDRTYLLQTPPNKYLRPRLLMLLLQSHQRRLRSPRSPHKWRVRLNNNIVFSAPVDDIMSREPGMDLVLPYGNHAAAAILDILVEFLQVVEAEVRDADGADLTCFLGLDESAPGAETGFSAAVGSVDKESAMGPLSCCKVLLFLREKWWGGLQVNVIKASLLETGLDSRFRLFVSILPEWDLGREEDI